MISSWTAKFIIGSTDLYKSSPDAVLPIHAVSYHVACHG